MQKILHMMTSGSTLRATAEGWTAEDGDMIRPDKPIGLSPSPGGQWYCYKTPMHAIADGWRLMGPPTHETWPSGNVYYYWWFERMDSIIERTPPILRGNLYE